MLVKIALIVFCKTLLVSAYGAFTEWRERRLIRLRLP